MSYFVAKNGRNLVRVGYGALLMLVAIILSLTVAPKFAPDDFRNVMPVLIFGWLPMYVSMCIAVTDHNRELDRFMGLAVMVVFTFFLGGVVGSGVSRDISMSPAYGWYLAIVCGSLAIVGGLVGLIIPRSYDLEDLKISLGVAMRRY